MILFIPDRRRKGQQPEKRARRIRNLFGKYISNEAVETILQQKPAGEGEPKNVIILFTAIRCYTALSERMDPRETIRNLKDYHSILVDIIMKHNGIINKFIGDPVNTASRLEQINQETMTAFS